MPTEWSHGRFFASGSPAFIEMVKSEVLRDDDLPDQQTVNVIFEQESAEES